jgi:hypothetical protein
MFTPEIVLPNLSTDPLWMLLQEESSLLLADLGNDPKYSERVMYIRALLAHPRFPQIEQIYLLPQMQRQSPETN